MKIGIDARMLDWAGVGRYTRELAKGLAQIDKENEYILFSNAENENPVPQATNFTKKVIDLPVFSPAGQFVWARLLKKANLDIFHSPHFVFPPVVPCPSVATIHDLIPLVHPEVLPFFLKRFYYRMQNMRAAKKATNIIADSSSTKQDIIRILGIAGEKIEVIPLATDKNFEVICSEDSLKKVRSKFNIGKRFILTLGNSKPHKNWTELIRAFHQLKKEKEVEHHLVLAGKQDPRFPQSKDLVRELKLEKNIRFIEFITEEDLPILYNCASVFVLPSLHEGFGLPVLEAMACGTPVICSNASSLPEVTGEAALLVNPNSEDLAKAIFKVLSDEETQKRLIREGRARARKFSWQKTAAKTLEVYKSVGRKRK
jgi:glycosyltransferase involved in cell wall biosynthesis